MVGWLLACGPKPLAQALTKARGQRKTAAISHQRDHIPGAVENRRAMLAAAKMLLHLQAQIGADFLIEVHRNPLKYVLAVEFHVPSGHGGSNGGPAQCPGSGQQTRPPFEHEIPGRSISFKENEGENSRCFAPPPPARHRQEAAAALLQAGLGQFDGAKQVGATRRSRARGHGSEIDARRLRAATDVVDGDGARTPQLPTGYSRAGTGIASGRMRSSPKVTHAT